MDGTATHDPRQGIQLYLSQDYPGAEALLSESVRANPGWTEGWSYLGFSQYMQQKYTEAAASLEKAVMQDQENPESRYGLGLVWAALKRVDAAIACWNETLRIQPNHEGAKKSLVGALIFRAQGSLADKDYDRAENDLERAFKIDRSSSDAVVVLVNHFESQNMTARAQKTVKDALAYLPNDGKVQALALKFNVTADKDAQVSAQDAQAKQQIQKSQEIPCPNCKKPIMEWAAICPHCNMQIKAMPSVFAGRAESVPAVEWQDVAFYFFTSIWILAGLVPLLIAAATGHLDKAFSGLPAFVNGMGLAMVGVGIGCLFKQETFLFLAKILCYLVLILFTANFAVFFFAGAYGGAAIYFGIISVTGFMIYLLNYMGS